MIGVSTVINNTAERIDPAMLTDVIMSSLSDKARVMINRGMGADGRPRYEDYMGAAKYQEDRFREDSQQAPRPDLMLSGEVRSSYAREKRGGLLSRGLLLRLTDGETVVWQGYATTSRGHPPGRGVVTTLSSLPYNGPLSKGQNWFVQGYVLEIMSNAVVKISVGSNQGFAVGDKLDLIEKTLRSAPKGGGFVGVEKTMGELEISILAPNSSEARHAGSLAVQKGWIVRRKTMPKSGQ